MTHKLTKRLPKIKAVGIFSLFVHVYKIIFQVMGLKWPQFSDICVVNSDHCGIHVREISQEILKIVLVKTNLKLQLPFSRWQ